MAMATSFGRGIAKKRYVEYFLIKVARMAYKHQIAVFAIVFQK